MHISAEPFEGKLLYAGLFGRVMNAYYAELGPDPVQKLRGAYAELITQGLGGTFAVLPRNFGALNLRQYPTCAGLLHPNGAARFAS